MASCLGCLRETPKGASFSHDAAVGRRAFVCSPYVLTGPGAAPTAVGELRCPESSSCRVSRDGHRRRRTGPGFPLQVMQCATHGHFTIYPMGHVPYGRAAVALVTAAGDPVTTSAAAPALSRWRRTLFEAVAAFSGPRWQSELARADAVQRRETAKAARILGLAPEIQPASAERIRGELSLPGLDHEKARRDYGVARGVVERALAIAPLLALLVLDRTLCGRLLRAGFLAGAWGPPVVVTVRPERAFPTPGPALSPPTAPAPRGAHESVRDPPGDPP